MLCCSKLRFLEYNYDFRDRYRYQNIMYSAAELAAETLDGRGWKQIVREELFQVCTALRLQRLSAGARGLLTFAQTHTHVCDDGAC